VDTCGTAVDPEPRRAHVCRKQAAARRDHDAMRPRQEHHRPRRVSPTNASPSPSNRLHPSPCWLRSIVPLPGMIAGDTATIFRVLVILLALGYAVTANSPVSALYTATVPIKSVATGKFLILNSLDICNSFHPGLLFISCNRNKMLNAKLEEKLR